MLFDPLNGLFGGKTELVNYLDSRMYQKDTDIHFLFSCFYQQLSKNLSIKQYN